MDAVIDRIWPGLNLHPTWVYIDADVLALGCCLFEGPVWNFLGASASELPQCWRLSHHVRRLHARRGSARRG